MGELFRRMRLRPVPAFELLVATVFVTLLNLASPIFVIQIMNRYVTFGFDGTLVTLTTGMFVAIALLYAFSSLRSRLADVVSGDEDHQLAAACNDVVVNARRQVLGPEVNRAIHEIPARVAAVRAAYEGSVIMQALDAPFALLYLAAACLLSPLLALIGLLGMAVLAVVSMWSNGQQEGLARSLEKEETERRRLTGAVLDGADTVRVFRAAGLVRGLWKDKSASIDALRFALTQLRERGRSLSTVVMLLQSVAVYSLGAMQVVNGDISIGVLIGVNILTSRATGAGAGLASALTLFSRARAARADLGRLLSLPVEASSGTAKRELEGRLELHDVGFRWPGNPSPLYESLDMRMEPGMLTLVQGPNGSGKTTFARMLAGLVEPARGDVLADGITLRQLAPDWWRTQISYLPQEPTFLPGTLRANICMAVSQPDEARLNQVINEADLATFVFSQSEGLETLIDDAGRSLPMGIRRRIALARALMTGGRVVILDEPTEALDTQGRKAVLRCLVRLVRERHTVVVVSSDPEIERIALQKLDLGSKPKPHVSRRMLPGTVPGDGNGGAGAEVAASPAEQGPGVMGPDAASDAVGADVAEGGQHE